MIKIIPILFLVTGIVISPGWGQEASTHKSVKLTSKMFHLRNLEPREWSSEAEKSDGERLEFKFDLEAPEQFRLLTWRQDGVERAWKVFLNGNDIGLLIRDHNHLEQGIEIPAGLLQPQGNHLEIATTDEIPDDIHLGDFTLHDTIQTVADDARTEELIEQRRYRRAIPAMRTSLHLAATEADLGTALPCRFTVIDAETGALVFIGAESDDRLAVREGVVYTLDGQAHFRLAGDAEQPRRYRIYCSRGFEYSLAREDLVVDGSADELSLTFALHHEVPTPGLVSCDTHLHTCQFDRHGDCNLTERLLSVIGEGVELAVSTAHNQHIDYREEADRIGASRWFTPLLGCEVTTKFGHFTSFPIEPGAAPAEHDGLSWAQIFQSIYATPGVKICVLNHGRDIHYNFRPFDPEHFDETTGTFAEGWKLEANAMELVNSGAHQSDPLRPVHDWFALLRSGHRLAGIGGSDSHTVNIAIPGQARTYLEVADNDPAAIDTDAAVESILKGQTWVSFGLLTRLDLIEEGQEKVLVQILGPSWTSATMLRLYRNGEEVIALPLSATTTSKPGLKFARDFAFEELGAKPGDFLCAVATGPGVLEGWWPMKPPYQPTSPDFEPFVIGISPALWVKKVK